MKLQLAIDTLNLNEAVSLVNMIQKNIDIVEIGTPLMMLEGRKAIKVMKEEFPALEILFDAKIADAGGYESRLAFEAGAEYVTVLAVAGYQTIEECVKEATKYQKKVVVDMINIEKFEETVPKLEEIGVDVLAVHTGVDKQLLGQTPLKDLKRIKKFAKRTEVAVAGGINEHTLQNYVEVNPDIIIVGSGITSADDPVSAAKKIYSEIKNR